MGGINIYCGSFRSNDKSGSAFESVLADISAHTSQEALTVIRSIQDSLNDAMDHVLIALDGARVLLPDLHKYCESLTGRMAAADPLEQVKLEEAKSGRRLEYNEGLGWRAYCAFDLLTACETALNEGEPIALVW